MVDRKCSCGRRLRKERLDKDLWACWECEGRKDACPFCGQLKGKENKRCQACRTIQQREAPKWCACGVLLTDENWGKGAQRKFSYRCKKCVTREVVKRNAETKREVFAHYGTGCECCGETDLRLLTLDHINQDGNAHRKTLSRKGGIDFYVWVRANEFPNVLRILCWNCNIGRYHNGGICPHEETRLKLVA
jgi:hypothetical protein